MHRAVILNQSSLGEKRIRLFKLRNICITYEWPHTHNPKFRNAIWCKNYKSINWDDVYQYCVLVNFIRFSIALQDKSFMSSVLSAYPSTCYFIPCTTTETCIAIKRADAPFWIIKNTDHKTTHTAQVVLQTDLESKKRRCKRKYILQKYICNPFLIKNQVSPYYNRKFVIRVIALLNQKHHLYVQEKFACKVAKREFTLQNLDPDIHTNLPDAITYQEFCDEYESADHNMVDLHRDINYIIGSSVTTVVSLLQNDVKSDFQKCAGFQLMSFDLLLDSRLKLHLVSTNIIPQLKYVNFDDVLKLTLDVQTGRRQYIPPSQSQSQSQSFILLAHIKCP